MTVYKVVIVLKNGARVSIFAPKELGLRKTYHANGQALEVDSGMVFDNLRDAKDFVAWHNCYVPASTKIEIWECNYRIGTRPFAKIDSIATWNAKFSRAKEQIISIFTRVNKTHRLLRDDYEYVGESIGWPYGTNFATDIFLTTKIEESWGRAGK